MNEVTTIGLDLAKNVFQIHGVDASGDAVIRRQLRRRQVIPFFRKLPPCLIGLEACATSHHWTRALQALGHEARIMPANYVKPYVKRNKNDAADAEAICEAVTRPTMRFVAVKSAAQQSLMMVHRTRSLLVRQRTMLVNAIRGHLAEFGIVARHGHAGARAQAPRAGAPPRWGRKSAKKPVQRLSKSEPQAQAPQKQPSSRACLQSNRRSGRRTASRHAIGQTLPHRRPAGLFHARNA